jgi:hypothetical protein
MRFELLYSFTVPHKLFGSRLRQASSYFYTPNTISDTPYSLVPENAQHTAFHINLYITCTKPHLLLRPLPHHMKHPTIKHSPIDRRKPDSIWLDRYRRIVTSQHGEDGVIEALFARIGCKHRFCVEFGAGDGLALSNTHTLINDHKWSALLIEGSESTSPTLINRYRGNPRVDAKRALVGLGDKETLDYHLRTSPLSPPQDFDLLSIDIDGMDFYVWDSLSQYRPRVVIIEMNQFIPNDVYFVQPPDSSINYGASLLALTELGKQKHYELAATTPSNAVFVVTEEYSHLNISDNSLDAMHFLGSNVTYLLQTPPGDLFLAGLKAHPWKGFALDEERMQVLPTNLRHWKFGGKIFPTKKLGT